VISSDVRFSPRRQLQIRHVQNVVWQSHPRNGPQESSTVSFPLHCALIRAKLFSSKRVPNRLIANAWPWDDEMLCRNSSEWKWLCIGRPAQQPIFSFHGRTTWKPPAMTRLVSGACTPWTKDSRLSENTKKTCSIQGVSYGFESSAFRSSQTSVSNIVSSLPNVITI
jgi:hypothetical protein